MHENLVSERLLLCTGFARAYLLAVSMNSGFIGGMIFPYLSMGAIAGVILHRYYPFLPLGYCLSCFMFAMPCGIVPMPLTFAVLGCFVFFLGSYETVPIFIAVLVSYLCLCGSGLVKKMNAQREKQEAAEKLKQLELGKKQQDDQNYVDA